MMLNPSKDDDGLRMTEFRISVAAFGPASSLMCMCQWALGYVDNLRDRRVWIGWQL
jgi:hypothetical protein